MDRPRLILPQPPQYPANVLIAFGFPWHVSEARAASEYFSTRLGLPKTVRAYEDPVNGSSRGIFYLEYPPAVPLDHVQSALRDKLQCPMALLHLTVHNWDRNGRLPDLPVGASVEPTVVGLAALRPTANVLQGSMQNGYGPEGYLIRCGPHLGLPNTVLQPEALDLWRKRQREVSS